MQMIDKKNKITYRLNFDGSMNLGPTFIDGFLLRGGSGRDINAPLVGTKIVQYSDGSLEYTLPSGLKVVKLDYRRKRRRSGQFTGVTRIEHPNGTIETHGRNPSITYPDGRKKTRYFDRIETIHPDGTKSVKKLW